MSSNRLQTISRRRTAWNLISHDIEGYVRNQQISICCISIQTGLNNVKIFPRDTCFEGPVGLLFKDQIICNLPYFQKNFSQTLTWLANIKASSMWIYTGSSFFFTRIGNIYMISSLGGVLDNLALWPLQGEPMKGQTLNFVGRSSLIR